MNYTHRARDASRAGILEENRLLRAKLERVETLRAQRLGEAAQRAKHRRPDEYPATTTEALQQALTRARTLFPESLEVKRARLVELNMEVRATQHYGTRKAAQ